MRIYNERMDIALSSVMLFLTKNEMQELRDTLDALIEEPPCEHEHIMDDEYKREITIASYLEGGTNSFAEKYNNLLKKDAD